MRVELHGLRHRKEKNSVRLGFEDCLRRYVLDAMQHAEVLDVLLHLGPRLRAERAENLTRVVLPLDPGTHTRNLRIVKLRPTDGTQDNA